MIRAAVHPPARSTKALSPSHRLTAGLCALVFVGTACGGGPSSAPLSPRPTSALAPTGSATPSPTPSCVEKVFATMTAEQRVGQLFIVGLANDRLGRAEIAGIRDHHFGSVTFIETTTMGASGVRAVTEAVQAQVSLEATAGIGFFVAANQEGGRIQALRGSGFSRMPTAVEQGVLDPSTLERRAARWGEQLSASGVNLNFAPVMDVVPAGTESQNAPIGALEREFGNDPATVGSHGVAFLSGMRRAGISTTAKHFPGLGRVEGNTDFTADVVDTATRPEDGPAGRGDGRGHPDAGRDGPSLRCSGG